MKPSLPKGTRDFGPLEVLKRNYIFDTIRSVFSKYGYAPIETPTMEALQTLTGKYGDEGDQLLFKVLNNGDYLKKADTTALESRDSKELTSSISKRGLRYDLTIPFARYVVMNQNDIKLPFKRYQIQPVWRADRPQKGRYQEFYQCDVDVVGSESLMYEAELMNIYSDVFNRLGIKTEILINNRKILFGIAEQNGLEDRFVEMTVALDKLDKIGEDKVKEEMIGKGIDASRVDAIFQLLTIDSLDELKNAFSNSPTGQKGIEELKTLHKFLEYSPVTELNFDITLARGLGYYTGCIFEVKVDTTIHDNIKMGSIGGGGRYANLTGSFGLPNVSGVGISFGAERIYDVMEELDLFPTDLSHNPEILLVGFDERGQHYAFNVVQKIRRQGINADCYPDFGKMKKQMKYADARGIKYVGIVGDNEIEKNTVCIKTLKTGDQIDIPIDEISEFLSRH